jgi:hypothetical protein
MKPHTDRLRRELDDVLQRGSALVARLDDQTLQRRPSAESWSVAECVDHLSATAELYVRRFRRTLDAATVRSEQPRESLSVKGWLLVTFMEPPVRRLRLKLPTPKLAPAPMPSRDALVQRFEDMHRQLAMLLEESDGYDRLKLRVTTPASKHLKITLVDGFSLLTAHCRRHLWQAERAAG